MNSRHFILVILTYIAQLCTVNVDARSQSECCSLGTRQYGESGMCGLLREARSLSAACRRSANICCLKELLDTKCVQGRRQAEGDGVCPHIGMKQLGGAIVKQCCDCCMLAKELLIAGQPCRPLTTMTDRCRQSFSHCCAGPTGTRHTQPPTPPAAPADWTRRPIQDAAVDQRRLPAGPLQMNARVQQQSRPNASDRCAQKQTNPCEHDCSDRGGIRVICTCRNGYQLNADMNTCTGIQARAPEPDRQTSEELLDSCEGSTTCDPEFERCVPRLNTNPGGQLQYVCMPLSLDKHTAPCRQGFRQSFDGLCVDINECSEMPHICGEHETCVNSLGAFQCMCFTGYSWHRDTQTCEDIDECLLMMDNCVEGQRCVNTEGGFRCMRTKACGTGWVLDTDTESCVDIDECVLGTHDCSGNYQCRNTPGSFRCEPRTCGPGEIMNPRTHHCDPVDCTVGYKPNPSTGECEDLDECAESKYTCRQFEKCINRPGSFDCVPKENFCEAGYTLDKHTGICIDVDECAERRHTCDRDSQCVNSEGSYRCRCDTGYEFNSTTRTCIDIDECDRFHGHVCSYNADCENTPGLFRCHCRAGYQLAADGRNCEDVDECKRDEHNCEQRCMNVPGGFQCICDPGYTLSADKRTCQDIDECEQWAGAGESLCMGRCLNTRGSYQCECPKGYVVQDDQRTCVDVDECAAGECQGNDRICVNTLGSFKCHAIDCPDNYVRDERYKNRCNRVPQFCGRNSTCMERAEYISHEYIALPKQVNFGDHETILRLFTLKGPHSYATTLRFEMTLTRAKPIRSAVLPAIRNDFLLQRGRQHNSVVVALRHPLDGPQDVYLDVDVKIYHVNTYVGRLVQDGYLCVQQCHSWDPVCLSNHTKSISYQYTAVPTVKFLRRPFEVARVRAESLDSSPFYVKYVMDNANADKFLVEQERNIGVVKLKSPVAGNRDEVVHLHMNVYSQNNVLVSHNVAIITVHVSRFQV